MSFLIPSGWIQVISPIKEKVAVWQLEKWGISAIEAGFPAASPDSLRAVQELLFITKASVTGLARSVKSDIDACYAQDAKYPPCFIATSPILRVQAESKGQGRDFRSRGSMFPMSRSKFEIVDFHRGRDVPGLDFLPARSCSRRQLI